MSGQLVSIFSRADIVQIPFTAFFYTTYLITSSYGDLEEAGERIRRIICLEGVEVGLPYGRKAPIFFTLMGQISPDDCYLTQRGRPRATVNSAEDFEDSESDPDDAPLAEVATFWLEERPNAVSALAWLGIGRTIRAITERFDEPNKVDTSHLVKYSIEERKYRIQFIWHGRPGESIVHNIRMYNSNGDREDLPRTVQEVPFHQPIEVVFTLQYVQSGDGETLMYACPLHIVRV